MDSNELRKSSQDVNCTAERISPWLACVNKVEFATLVVLSILPIISHVGTLPRVVAGLGLICLIVRRISLGEKLFPNRFVVVMLLLLVLNCIAATLYSQSIRTSLHYLRDFLTFVVAFCIALDVLRSRDVLVRYLAFVAVIYCAAVMWGLVWHVCCNDNPTKIFSGKEGYYTVYAHKLSLMFPVILACCAALWERNSAGRAVWLPALLGLALAMLLLEIRKDAMRELPYAAPIFIGAALGIWLALVRRPLLIASLIFIAGSIVLTTCRTAMATLALAGFLYVFVVLRKSRYFLIWLLLLLFMGASFFFLPQMDRVFNFESLKQRRIIWKSAYGAIAARPVAGYGLGKRIFRNTWRDFASEADLKQLAPGFKARHTHNLWLQLLFERGIIGCLIFSLFWCAVVLGIVRKLKSSGDEAGRRIRWAFIMGLVVVLIGSVVDYYFSSDRGMLVWLLGGLALAGDY